MAITVKAGLMAIASAAVALSMTACGGSTSSTMSSASSAASSAASAATSAATSAASSASSAASSGMSSAAAAAGAPTEGSLASMCTDIDKIMLGNPDADPAGTAQQLEAIKAKITTPDADLVGNVADAYTAIAANPTDTAAQNALSTASSALGAGCQSATGTPKPN